MGITLCSIELTRIVPVMVATTILSMTAARPAAAFCEDRNDGSTCHTHMVEAALPFLRPQLLDQLSKAVLYTDDSGFLNTAYRSEDHFDSCNFSGGTGSINDWLSVALKGNSFGNGLSPNENTPEPFHGIINWAAALHGAQDFYAHSNWIEMGLAGIVGRAGLGGTELIDSGLGYWTEIDGTAFVVRPGIYHFNGDVPSGWSTFPDNTLPSVQSVTGNFYHVLVSGEVFDPTQDCASDLDVDHDDINKDNINRVNHLEAQLTSIRQTRHEWCRLLHLAYDDLDYRTAAVMMGLMVEPGASPHSCGTACAADSVGIIGVTVTVDRIKVLDDHNNNGPGDLNLVLSLFTGDFRRSIRSQAPMVAVNTGDVVPAAALPDPVSLCLDANDEVVVTVQGWEDDGLPGVFSEDDDVLVGTSRWIGLGVDIANAIPFTLGSYTLTSDSNGPQDLEVDITITSSGANGLTDCESHRRNTDLLNADDSSGFADIVVEYFDSGNGSLSCPEGQGGDFPPPASSASCVPFSVVLGDDPGQTSDYLSLPEGSFITVGFVKGAIIDGPGNDIVISEVGNAAEHAEIYVSALPSTNPPDFTFLGTANGNTITAFDLASIGFAGQVRSVKVLSLENGGFPSAPGFDLAHVEAINFSAAPLPPAINIEKLTNGNQADGADDPDVPRLEPGATITWAYEVTNTGGDAFAEAELTVTDSHPGVVPILDAATDNGDRILSPGEAWTYTATAHALDLTGQPDTGITILPGCNDDRNTYENKGRVDIACSVVFDEDLSHYCNPIDSDEDGISDNEDNCILVPNGPLNPDAGGNSQLDTDGDGFGNRCDPDLNNDLRIDFADLAELKSVFFTADTDADLNGDLRVDFADLAIQKQMFFGPPGPSSQAP